MALRDSSGQVLGGTARLAVEGEEWRPGRDYEILSKIGGSAAGVIGGGEGCESIVFKIRRLRQPVVAADEPAPGTASDELYALKQVIHFDQMREHEADEELWARHGAEWRVMMQLPPHECLLPVLHHYHSDVPSLCDQRWGMQGVIDELRAAAATRTLFIVLPLYDASLRACLRGRPAGASARPPYGLGWALWGELLLRMLRAVAHLIGHGVVHGDLKDDQWLLHRHADGTPDPASLVLGDFGERAVSVICVACLVQKRSGWGRGAPGTAWRVDHADGSPKLLGGADPAAELLGRRCGAGWLRPPELRGRADHPAGSRARRPLRRFLGGVLTEMYL
jgi:hypothetical protein